MGRVGNTKYGSDQSCTKLTLRIPDRIHRPAIVIAQQLNMSFNDFAVDCLYRALKKYNLSELHMRRLKLKEDLAFVEERLAEMANKELEKDLAEAS